MSESTTDKAVPFWRRLDWRIWRHSYIAETPEAERVAWISIHGDVAPDGVPRDLHGKTRWQARVRDIALGGINLLVNHRFDSGTLLRVEVQRASDIEPRVLLARVIHVTTRAGGMFLLGCCFARELTDEDLRTFGAERVRPANPDGRAWVRFPCEMETSFQSVVSATQDKTRAKVINISAGGIALAVDRPCQAGTLLSIEIVQPGEEPRNVQARIIRVTPQEGNVFVLGCTFVTELSSEDLEALM